jgi:hypothetical protein
MIQPHGLNSGETEKNFAAALSLRCDCRPLLEHEAIERSGIPMVDFARVSIQ